MPPPCIEGSIARSGPILVLTGAGISAESGIPTFRGTEGIWTVGSRHYRPQELATLAAFQAMPTEIWGWYLYRLGLCMKAAPNAAHRALVSLEEALGNRFLLITQNVDGLHLRAGQSSHRTYEIHGNIGFMRCSHECSSEVRALPESLTENWNEDRALGTEELNLLACPHCGELSRPHVLWFDECYDEDYYRYESSLEAAQQASLLIVVGTSGATSLPMHIAEICAARETPMVVIDPADNPFSAMARGQANGKAVAGTAVSMIPALVDEVIDQLA